MYIFLLLQNFYPLVWYPLLLGFHFLMKWRFHFLYSYQLSIGILRTFPSLPIIYITVESYILIHSLGYYHYLMLRLCPVWPVRVPLSWPLGPFCHVPVGALLPATRCFRCILYLNYLSPEICHFSKDGNLYFRQRKESCILCCFPK